MKEEYSLLRATIELVFIKQLNETKWYQFRKRSKIARLRDLRIKEMEARNHSRQNLSVVK